MPERNAHSYCTVIRGMVKVKFSSVLGGLFSAREISRAEIVCLLHSFVFFQHGASAKAYDMYTELLNDRHKGKHLLFSMTVF